MILVRLGGMSSLCISGIRFETTKFHCDSAEVLT